MNMKDYIANDLYTGTDVRLSPCDVQVDVGNWTTFNSSLVRHTPSSGLLVPVAADG